MFNYKKLPVVLLFSMLLVSVFAAQLFAAEKITINELMFSGAAQEVLLEQAKRFMEENPNIEVNITWTDYASLHEKMMTELVGGTGRYDVMAAITDFMPEFIGVLVVEVILTPLLVMLRNLLNPIDQGIQFPIGHGGV